MTSREEVAQKLREAARTFDKEYPNGAKDWLDENAAFNTVDEIIGTDNNITYAPFFSRLADLIDPICKYPPCVCVTWVDDNGEEHEEENLEEPGYSENAYCSVCGYEMMTGEEGWFDYKHEEHGNRLIPNFNYCPNCGARVVSQDA